MTNLDNLYAIAYGGFRNGAHFFDINLDPSHGIFEGHFPGHPVLPGVCTLRIVKSCMEHILGREVRYDTISVCKFISLITPADGPVEVSLSLSDGNSFQSVIRVGERTVLKLKASYAE